VPPCLSACSRVAWQRARRGLTRTDSPRPLAPTSTHRARAHPQGPNTPPQPPWGHPSLPDARSDSTISASRLTVNNSASFAREGRPTSLKVTSRAARSVQQVTTTVPQPDTPRPPRTPQNIPNQNDAAITK
jgi:hypothetical protein